MTLARRIRLRIMQWFWFAPDRVSVRLGDRAFDASPEWLWNAFDHLQDRVAKITCWAVGHEPMSECGIPEHDHCLFCGKSMPGQVVRLNRANESADLKS